MFHVLASPLYLPGSLDPQILGDLFQPFAMLLADGDAQLTILAVALGLNRSRQKAFAVADNWLKFGDLLNILVHFGLECFGLDKEVDAEGNDERALVGARPSAWRTLGVD